MEKIKCPNCKKISKSEHQIIKLFVVSIAIALISIFLTPLRIVALGLIIFTGYKFYKEKSTNTKKYFCLGCKKYFLIKGSKNDKKQITKTKIEKASALEKAKHSLKRISIAIGLCLLFFFYLGTHTDMKSLQTLSNSTANSKLERQQKKLTKKQEEKLKKTAEYEKFSGVCSRVYIEEMLAPSPADFPIKSSTYDEERDLYRISSYVDTVNLFNAPIRKRYYCEISGVNLETYTCQKHDCEWES